MIVVGILRNLWELTHNTVRFVHDALVIFLARVKKENMFRFIFGLSIILLDQISKYWVAENILYGSYISVTSFFKIVHFQNTGAAFSFLHNASGWQNYFFIILTGIILIYLFYLFKKNKDQKYTWLSLLLIVSGAIGNLIDRVINGYVTDFIYIHYNEMYWPAFNVADSVISIGAFLYLYALCKGQIK